MLHHGPAMNATLPHISGTELRSRRLAAGMSRQQLAQLVGVDAAAVGDWESGERPIECEAAVRQALRSLASRGTDSRDELRH